MLDSKLVAELADKVFKDISKNFSDKQDISKTLKVVIEQAISKLDLVTREEFDAQSRVLASSKQQLAVLAQKVSELEKSNKN